MKKRAIARRLAKELQISTGNAADQIDRVVHDIIQNLKAGEQVSVPGFGTFKPGPRPRFQREAGREE